MNSTLVCKMEIAHYYHRQEHGDSLFIAIVFGLQFIEQCSPTAIKCCLNLNILLANTLIDFLEISVRVTMCVRSR